MTASTSPEQHPQERLTEGASQRIAGYLPVPDAAEERKLLEIRERLEKESSVRTHYYVKIAVSSFLCMLLLVIGVPVFVMSRITGSISYTALGVVLVGFGLVLAVAVIVLLFRPPWRK